MNGVNPFKDDKKSIEDKRNLKKTLKHYRRSRRNLMDASFSETMSEL